MTLDASCLSTGR